jgi:pyridoxamine 5'-phosphate oxidase
MIKFQKLNKEAPYKIFKKNYEAAESNNQKNIEAVSISSFSKELKEVNSRFVNLKFIKNNEFIFFSNYKSPKSIEFEEHDQISALIFWNSINIQIRIKAKIKKTTSQLNKDYFFDRDEKKNALAISSRQSQIINSYTDIKDNFNNSFKLNNLRSCPDYWGGFSFKPYYFEFWEGHQSRLNKRDVYELSGEDWIHSILQP